MAGQKRTKEAVACYCKVVTLHPGHSEARRLLGLAYCTLGERDKAVELFERWLGAEPDNPVARHMFAACSGDSVPERASDAYIEKIFDDFAASFEVKLAGLSYRAPALIAAALVDAHLSADKQFDVLDAGCGTGLCGPLLAPYAHRLVGVDLSEKMLAAAHEKGVYDMLVKDELTGYLRTHADAFDVIVSADTLVYFGAVEQVFAAAAGALRRNGLLIFTVESPTESNMAGYHLHFHGRYSHDREYLIRALDAAGFAPNFVPVQLRMEGGQPVAGLLVTAAKPTRAANHAADAGVSAVGRDAACFGSADA